MNYDTHPIADIFPMMSDGELDRLAEDIRVNGLQVPIWRHKDGRIIDSRNRLVACQRAGVEPRMKTYERGDDGLAEFVVSLNLHRCHLDESQRAMVAARLATLKKGTNQHTAVAVSSITQPQAADLLNVSVDSVQRARKVIENGSPELSDAVNQGDISVKRAADIVNSDLNEKVKAGEMTVEDASSQIKKRPRKPMIKKAPSTDPETQAASESSPVRDADMHAVHHVMHLLRNLADKASEFEAKILLQKTPRNLWHNYASSLPQAHQFVSDLLDTWQHEQNGSENAAEVVEQYEAERQEERSLRESSRAA